MIEEMKISDVEKNIRASAVMYFVGMIRGAYDSGFIDNHPTNYDIYRSAQMHVKDRYGVETDNWDDELAKESRSDNHDRLTQENQQLREAFSDLYESFYGEYSSGALTYKQDMAMLADKQLLSQLESKDD